MEEAQPISEAPARTAKDPAVGITEPPPPEPPPATIDNPVCSLQYDDSEIIDTSGTTHALENLMPEAILRLGEAGTPTRVLLNSGAKNGLIHTEVATRLGATVVNHSHTPTFTLADNSTTQPKALVRLKADFGNGLTKNLYFWMSDSVAMTLMGSESFDDMQAILDYANRHMYVSINGRYTAVPFETKYRQRRDLFLF